MAEQSGQNEKGSLTQNLSGLIDRARETMNEDSTLYKAREQISEAAEALRRSANEYSEGLQQLHSLSSETLAICALLLLGALIMALLAIFVGLPVLPIMPAKFGIALSLSSIMSIGALSVIRGVKNQALVMLSPSRRGISVAYAASIALTLWGALSLRSYPLAMVGGFLQAVLSCLYVASTFPGGYQGFKLLLSSSISVCSRCLGVSPPQLPL